MRELRQEKKDALNRGNTLLDEVSHMNFFFIFGCRPSAGVKANTTMVKDILSAFIENKDRVNAMVQLPQVFEFLSSGDATFETASSTRI